MSLAAIPSVLATAPTGATGPSSNAPVAQQPQPAPTTPAYTVELTEAQRVYQLYNQGLPVPQIATNLSLSVAAVNSYLNISNSSS
jgi:DNA-binding NarL/FixJ family response regulator